MAATRAGDASALAGARSAVRTSVHAPIRRTGRISSFARELETIPEPANHWDDPPSSFGLLCLVVPCEQQDVVVEVDLWRLIRELDSGGISALRSSMRCWKSGSVSSFRCLSLIRVGRRFRELSRFLMAFAVYLRPCLLSAMPDLQSAMNCSCASPTLMSFSCRRTPFRSVSRSTQPSSSRLR